MLHPPLLEKTGDISGQRIDASWLLKFTTDGETYTIEYRGSRYVSSLIKR